MLIINKLYAGFFQIY